eukprot:15457940-Alexandrium_andersonii.AAC.1
MKREPASSCSSRARRRRRARQQPARSPAVARDREGAAHVQRALVQPVATVPTCWPPPALGFWPLGGEVNPPAQPATMTARNVCKQQLTR